MRYKLFLRYKYLIFFVLCFSLISCFEKDEMINSVKRDDVFQVEKSVYTYQTYFDLSGSKIITEEDNKSWDLGFETGVNGWHIILNSSKFMKVAVIANSDFTNIKSGDGLKYTFDRSNGHIDSTGIGDWRKSAQSNIYVIDRGVDETGISIGFKKVVLINYSDNSYKMKFADLDGNNEVSYTIDKDTTVDFVKFSFEKSGTILNSQVKKMNWDINFSQYSTILYDNNKNAVPYLVRGALINTNGSEVAIDSLNSFLQITSNLINSYKFSKYKDAIGYDWKTYTNGIYIIRQKVNYIIKDLKGNYYKFRFISFFNNKGENGYPQFEYVKIK
jgi:hypothetical protein